MFGQTSQPEPQSQPTPSSFSFPAPQQATPLFGSSNAAGTNSAFGGSSQAASTFGASPQPSSLFGSSGSTQPSSAGLFGQTVQPTVQPSQLFGMAAPTPHYQNLNPVPTGCQQVAYPTTKLSSDSGAVVTSFEVEGKVADMLVSICGKRFRVCSSLLVRRSRKVQKEVSSKEAASISLLVDLPLATDPTAFVKWLHTLDMATFLSTISTLEAQVDMLALGVYFDLNPELHFEPHVLGCTVSASVTVFSPLPSCWDRAFIPLDLAIKTINKYRNTGFGLFGSSAPSQPNSVATQMALEWLGERRCFSAEEVESLRESAEFRQMKRVLQENYFLPGAINDYLLLAKRYPVGIDVFTIGDMFKSIGLL